MYGTRIDKMASRTASGWKISVHLPLWRISTHTWNLRRVSHSPCKCLSKKESMKYYPVVFLAIGPVEDLRADAVAMVGFERFAL